MSGIKIVGNSSGTGTFTISSPNSNTSRTLTLPDTSGTLVTGDDIAINGITSDYTSGTALNVDSSGIVTKSTQPAFLARFTGGSDQTLTDGSAVTLEFSEEIYDTGSDYDTSTYTFTAPVTGKYLLTFGVRVDVIQSDASYYRPQIHTSNRPYYDIFDSAGFSADTSYQSFTMSVIADMDASDVARAYMRQQGGTAVSHVDASNGYSWFSGYLLG